MAAAANARWMEQQRAKNDSIPKEEKWVVVVSPKTARRERKAAAAAAKKRWVESQRVKLLQEVNQPPQTSAETVEPAPTETFQIGAQETEVSAHATIAETDQPAPSESPQIEGATENTTEDNDAGVRLSTPTTPTTPNSGEGKYKYIYIYIIE